MAFQLTEGYIDLTVKSDAFKKAMSKVEKTLEKVGKTIAKVTGRINKLQFAMSTIRAPFAVASAAFGLLTKTLSAVGKAFSFVASIIKKAAGIIIKAIRAIIRKVSHLIKRLAQLTIVLSVISLRAFSNFETAMRKATSVSEATEKQFREMSDMAIRQSERLNFAATKTAEAFYFLGSAGLSVTDQMGAYIPVATLARAATMEMGATAEMVVDTMKGFRIGFEETTRVTDVLAKGVTSSNMNFEQLGQTMSMISGVAEMTNNSLEETVALVGTMANVGIKGTRAGTALRRALLNIAAPMSSIRSELNKWGVDVYDAERKMKPFIQIVGELSDALKDATEEQRNMAFKTLFGARAIGGQIAIFNQGKVALEKFTEELEKSGGTAQQIADKQMKSFGNQVGIVWQKIKNLSRTIGEALAPGVLRLVKAVGEVVEALQRFSGKHLLTIQKWGEITAVIILELTRTLIDFAKYMKSDWPEIWKWASNSTISLVSALATGVSSVFKELWKNFEVYAEKAFIKIRTLFETVLAKSTDIFSERAELHLSKIGAYIDYLLQKFKILGIAMAWGPIAGPKVAEKLGGLNEKIYEQKRANIDKKLSEMGPSEYNPLAQEGDVKGAAEKALIDLKKAFETVKKTFPSKIKDIYKDHIKVVESTIESINNKYKDLEAEADVRFEMDLPDDIGHEAPQDREGRGRRARRRKKRPQWGGVNYGGAGGFQSGKQAWKGLASTVAGGGVQQNILAETKQARHDRLKADRMARAAEQKQRAYESRSLSVMEKIVEKQEAGGFGNW